MFTKVFAVLCLLGLISADNLYLNQAGYGRGSGGYGRYGGYSGYGSYGRYGGHSGYGHAFFPTFSYAPVITKTYVAAPVVKYIAPAHAISAVHQYSFLSSPKVQSYAPASYTYHHPDSPAAYGNGGYGTGSGGYGK